MWTSHIHKVRPRWMQIFCFLVFTISTVTSAPFYFFESHSNIVPVHHQPFYLVQSPHYVHQESVQSNEYRQADESPDLPVVYQNKGYFNRGETNIPPQPNVKPPRGPVRIFFLFSRFPWPIEPFIQRVQNYFSTYTIPTQEPLLAEEIDIAPDPGHDELEPDIGPARPAPPEENTQAPEVTTETVPEISISTNEISSEMSVSSSETPITTANSPVTTVTLTTDNIPVTTVSISETTGNTFEVPVTTEASSSSLSTRSVRIRTTNKLKFPMILPNQSFII